MEPKNKQLLLRWNCFCGRQSLVNGTVGVIIIIVIIIIMLIRAKNFNRRSYGSKRDKMAQL